MVYKRWLRLLALGIALCLALGSMALSAGADTREVLLTPTPIPTENVAALAREVEANNALTGNTTLWRGGRLGGGSESTLTIGYGRKMAGFALDDVSGEPVIVDRVEGPKLINFWASWCGPCIDEFPLLAEAALDAEAPFEVVFIGVWDEREAAISFLSRQPTGLRAALEGDAVSDAIGIMSIPTSLLIDSDGVMRAIHVGDITPPVMDFLYALARDLE